MTASQAESSSAPEAIEDQPESGGPYGTVSLFGDTQHLWTETEIMGLVGGSNAQSVKRNGGPAPTGL